MNKIITPQSEGFSERLKKAVKMAGGVQAVSKAMETAQSTLYSWFKGPNTPPISFIYDLCSLAGVRIEWLMTGAPPEKSGDDSGDWETALTVDPSSHRRVPIYDIAVSAGHGTEPWDEDPIDYATMPIDWLRTIGDPDSLDLLRVDGDSMEPELRDADLVFVDRSQTQAREGIFVVRVDHQLLIKRLRVLGGGRAELVSNNPAYPPIAVMLDGDGFEIKGRVRKAIRAV